MRHLLFALLMVALLGCKKEGDSPTTPPAGTKASPPAAPQKDQPKNLANDPAKTSATDSAKNATPDATPDAAKDIGKDNSADVKVAMDRGIALAKGGDKAKVSAWSKSLVLPNHESWFKRVFGDEVGKKLAAEYGENSKEFDELGGLLEDASKRGATEIRITRVTDASDREATGLQKSALEAMKKKGPLYTVKFCEPGKTDASLSLWSFVVADGKPYLLGKMKAVK